MEAQAWAERAKLDPTSEKLPIHRAEVAADVVTPPAEAHVGGGGGEVRQRGQCRPAAECIAAEADRIAMIPEAAPAAEDQRALAPASRVGEVQMVEPGERIHPGEVAACALLPVDPPEIDALLFKRVMQQREVVLGKLAVGDAKGNGSAIACGHAERGREFRVGGLVRMHAVGGMQIQRDAQSASMHFGQERGRHRERVRDSRYSQSSGAAGASPCRRPARRAATHGRQTR